METSGTVTISRSEETEERRKTEEMEEMEAKRRKVLEKDDKEEKEEKEREKPILHTRSIYHGSLSDFKDYLGRSFVYPPSDLKLYDHECFLPKKNIHTW